ncbi:MAG: LytR/AlgR family response regulator transcription factor [Candidatus Izemoplasmatales bacterium]|jgi:two-component system response regulator LytT
MKNLNIAVVDDEKSALNIIGAAIKSVFEKNNINANIDCYFHQKALKELPKYNEYDLFFLDIHMPEKNGILFGRELVSCKKDCEIIFVSNDSSKVFEALEINPFGYIRKENFLDDTASTIERYIKKKTAGLSGASYIEIKSRNAIEKVNVNLIEYIECFRNDQHLHMVDGSCIVVRSRMTIIEQKLSPYNFLRIHKGYIVNLDCIRRFETNAIILNSQKKLPLARDRKKIVKEKFLEYVNSKGVSIIG